MISLFRNGLAFLICCFCSFLSYLICQIGVYFFIPLTILPVAIFFTFGYKIPALLIIALGILDDVMTNSPLGTFAVTYSIISYILATVCSKTNSPTRLIYIFSGIYIVVNFILLINQQF